MLPKTYLIASSNPAPNFEFWRTRAGRVRIGAVGSSCQLQVNVRTSYELQKRVIDEIELGYPRAAWNFHRAVSRDDLEPVVEVSGCSADDHALDTDVIDRSVFQKTIMPP